MVKETRIVVTPGDVLCVRITCPRCQNGVLMKLDNEPRVVRDRCPVCDHAWTLHHIDYPTVDIRAVQDLLANLRQLATNNANYVELEFKDTEQRT